MAQYHQPILITLLCLIVGCHSISEKTSHELLKDFDRTDAIMLKNGTSITTLSDRNVVQKLRDIYSNSKWKPYKATLPGNLDERTITLYADGKELRHFSYNGSLWESKSYTENRIAKLSVSQQTWFEALFSQESNVQK